MGLETATYIDGLNAAWPLGTDDKGQGTTICALSSRRSSPRSPTLPALSRPAIPS